MPDDLVSVETGSTIILIGDIRYEGIKGVPQVGLPGPGWSLPIWGSSGETGFGSTEGRLRGSLWFKLWS